VICVQPAGWRQGEKGKFCMGLMSQQLRPSPAHGHFSLHPSSPPTSPNGCTVPHSTPQPHQYTTAPDAELPCPSSEPEENRENPKCPPNNSPFPPEQEGNARPGSLFLSLRRGRRRRAAQAHVVGADPARRLRAQPRAPLRRAA
jgi:hypothetical protein